MSEGLDAYPGKKHIFDKTKGCLKLHQLGGEFKNPGNIVNNLSKTKTDIKLQQLAAEIKTQQISEKRILKLKLT